MDDNDNGPTPFDGPEDDAPREFDPEWQQFLISQLPAEVAAKFNDPHEAEAYFMRIDREVRKLGLVYRDAKLAVSPTDNKAYIQITCEIDPSEDAYQMEKQMRSMMYDSEEEEFKRRMDELRAEVEGGEEETEGDGEAVQG